MRKEARKTVKIQEMKQCTKKKDMEWNTFCSETKDRRRERMDTKMAMEICQYTET